MIIYSCLLKSSQYTNLTAPHKWGIPTLKEIYAHVIHGPMKHNQGTA